MYKIPWECRAHHLDFIGPGNNLATSLFGGLVKCSAMSSCLRKPLLEEMQPWSPLFWSFCRAVALRCGSLQSKTSTASNFKEAFLPWNEAAQLAGQALQRLEGSDRNPLVERRKDGNTSQFLPRTPYPSGCCQDFSPFTSRKGEKLVLLS